MANTVIAFIYRSIILPNKPSFKQFSCESYKTFYIFAWGSCTVELKEDSLIAGAAAGALAAYLMSRDKFKSIPDVIKHDMTDAQREQLAASVLAVIADFSVEDYAMLLELVLNNSVTTEAVLKVVFAFIQEEMQQEIVDKNEGISHINDTLQTDEYFENDTSLLVLANQKQMY